GRPVPPARRAPERVRAQRRRSQGGCPGRAAGRGVPVRRPRRGGPGRPGRTLRDGAHAGRTVAVRGGRSGGEVLPDRPRARRDRAGRARRARPARLRARGRGVLRRGRAARGRAPHGRGADARSVRLPHPGADPARERAGRGAGTAFGLRARGRRGRAGRGGAAPPPAPGRPAALRMSVFARWLMNREPVHRAATGAEREAIWRFRYEVYIEELKYHYAAADHERRWLRHEEDEQPYTTLLYTGAGDGVTGVVQIRAWEPGQVPRHEFEALSLESFPGMERVRVAEVGRLMTRRSLRGTLLLPSLMRAGYEFMAGEAKTDLAFVDCSPGLVRYYRRLGALPYGGRLLVGPGVPLLLVPSDEARLRRLGSPVAPLVKKHFGPGKRAPLDLTPFRPLLEGDAVPVEFDAEKVWGAFESRLLRGA